MGYKRSLNDSIFTVYLCIYPRFTVLYCIYKILRTVQSRANNYCIVMSNLKTNLFLLPKVFLLNHLPNTEEEYFKESPSNSEFDVDSESLFKAITRAHRRCVQCRANNYFIVMSNLKTNLFLLPKVFLLITFQIFPLNHLALFKEMSGRKQFNMASWLKPPKPPGIRQEGLIQCPWWVICC